MKIAGGGTKKRATRSFRAARSRAEGDSKTASKRVARPENAMLDTVQITSRGSLLLTAGAPAWAWAVFGPVREQCPSPQFHRRRTSTWCLNRAFLKQ